MNGFLNVLKPPGMSSAAVVGYVKRQLNQKKVGHAGTLDPEAAGVLPIMIGRATRLFEYLADKEKAYVAEIAFGAATDTQDAQGKVIQRGSNIPSQKDIEAVLGEFLGEIRQTPSAFSAIKQNGKPLYELARKGETVNVPERIVRVDAIALMEKVPNNGFMLKVDCGRGTYIRTMCHDIGKRLNCPAHMRFLLRTRSGAFGLDTAVTLEEIAQGKKNNLLPMDMPLTHFRSVQVPKQLWKKAINGGKMPADAFEDLCNMPVRVYMADRFMGMAQKQGDVLRYLTMVYDPEEE